MGGSQENTQLSGTSPQEDQRSARAKGLGGVIASSIPAGLRLAGSFMQLLVTVLIARLLGVEAAGIYFFWAALMLETGQSAAFGLDKLAVRELPRVESKGKAAITAFLAPLRSTGLMIAWMGAFGLFVYSELSGSKVMDGVGWWLILTASVSGVTLSMINSESMTGLGKPVMAVIYRHTLPTTIL
ncbi:MAG: hypothetical protein HRU46_09495, partial [Verrucomicrobiales bacterium]|nr:hypothetical protein [Verrucomicrobiales bacterium]